MGRFNVLHLILAIFCFTTSQFSCNGDTHVANCSKSDLEALLDFKNGLNDPENRLLSWQGNKCCQWRGIECDNSTNSVIKIDLHNPYPLSYDSTSSRYGFWNLSGEIRPSLLKLKFLRQLDLSFNTFQDIPIPKFIGSLKNLQYLNISKAGFLGTIPPNLGNLSRLQVLDVSSEFSSLSVDDLDWVTGLVSIKHLEMNQVDLSLANSNWVDVFNTLPLLTELHLSLCGLSGSILPPTHINFTSLAVIDLTSNNFNSKFPDWIANLSSLVYIDMSSCALFGRIPIGISELPSLRYLDLSLNDNLSANCEELFGGSWKSIEVIDIATNKLHGKLPDSLGNISSLTNLNLFVNEVEGGIPSSIGGLCKLIDFNLMGNNLNGNLPKFLEGTEKCVSKSPLPSLLYLRLSVNRLVGELPSWLGEIENLVELTLGYNLLEGTIPDSIGTLQNLTVLSLEGNELVGTIPISFGQLSELSSLDVSLNHLTGIVSEAHFSKLSKLRFLILSSNSLILNFSSNWVPPFQVGNLDLGSCQLGPSFPIWLESQKKLEFLDISNSSISGPIPSWFWELSSNLSLLNVSMNRLEGQIPNPLNVAPYADIDFSSNLFEGLIPLPDVQIELLDLSDNKFSGPIPLNISESMPELIFLSLSHNQLTGEMPESIGEMLSLQVIDLSYNNLTGKIPDNLGNCSFLKALDLRNNNFSGLIPSSLGRLRQLQSLHLNDNMFSGEIPSSFLSLSSLETLDLGKNGLSGKIATWVGIGFANLRILNLRSNSFSGEIPNELSNSSSLQVIDLANNKFSGKIPVSFWDLKSMTEVQKVNEYLLYGKYRGRYYEESLVVNLKGNPQRYTKTLSLVTVLDLSGNNLSGDFPMEITKLFGLVVLNLSRNRISGQIPQNISKLRQLGSLDLSSNELLGEIPQSLEELNFLGFLNLSSNNFSGRIPYNGHMTTFDESAFEWNLGLCGAPLVVKCQSEDSDKGKSVENDDTSGDEFIDKWFYLSVGLGFAAGILVPCLVLAIRKPWSDFYFKFIDHIVYGLVRVENRLVMEFGRGFNFAREARRGP